MYSSAFSLNSALNGMDFYLYAPEALPLERTTVSIVQETGWALGTLWMDGENLAPTDFRYSKIPARSKSLYRPEYYGLQ
jgi:hypothetical protein